MALVSVIIPSRKERFLNQTIKDVLSNSTGEIEIFPVLDGYDAERIDDPRVKYIFIPDNGAMQKRQGVNAAVSIAKGKYVMCLDAHCMVGKGFDEILAKDCEDNWIVIPRRYKLDPENWTIRQDVPPIDYEYWLWRPFIKDHILKPYGWDRPERRDIMIDDTLTMQASLWFCHKKYFNRMGFMKTERYTGWGTEDVELAMETWTTGGRVVVNKKTWYAHLFKGKTYGRMYQACNSQIARSREYAFNYWCVQRKDDFMKVIDKFMPIPHWGN